MVDVTKKSIVQPQGFLDRYSWNPLGKVYPADALAPPKYDSPTAQLNATLLSNEIPTTTYDPDGTET